ncbi:hypothetical protein E2320_006144 [Naja naja]|nr:hypothetical protein E2320_006144 [Naja naja]
MGAFNPLSSQLSQIFGNLTIGGSATDWFLVFILISSQPFKILLMAFSLFYLGGGTVGFGNNDAINYVDLIIVSSCIKCC